MKWYLVSQEIVLKGPTSPSNLMFLLHVEELSSNGTRVPRIVLFSTLAELGIVTVRFVFCMFC